MLFISAKVLDWRSWSNWFINLDGQMSNLALNCTLRNSTDPDVRKPQRKMLTLECVRNKDRMAVELVERLTRPELVEVLNKVSLVVHTLVPERCRYCHPIAIFPGPLGSVLALDLIRIWLTLLSTAYDKATPTSRGNRAEQRYKRFHLFMFQQRCGFYDRAWYIKACITYHDLEGKVPHFKHETFSSLPYATDL